MDSYPRLASRSLASYSLRVPQAQTSHHRAQLRHHKTPMEFSFHPQKIYKHRAASDVGFIFIAYNLKRILKVIGWEEFGIT